MRGAGRDGAGGRRYKKRRALAGPLSAAARSWLPPGTMSRVRLLALLLALLVGAPAGAESVGAWRSVWGGVRIAASFVSGRWDWRGCPGGTTPPHTKNAARGNCWKLGSGTTLRAGGGLLRFPPPLASGPPSPSCPLLLPPHLN